MGVGASGSDVSLVDVVHVGSNDHDGGGNPCKITKACHREEGAENHTQHMGNTGN